MVVLLKVVEILTAFSLLASKYLLAKEHIFGWVLALFGYILITYFNIQKKLYVMAVSAGSLIFLTIYGFIKWGGYVPLGLHIADWVIVLITLILAMYVSYHQFKKKNTLWVLELVGTWLSVAAYIFLAFYNVIGWVALACMHIIFGYVFLNKKAWFLVGLNIISFAIALFKIITTF